MIKRRAAVMWKALCPLALLVFFFAAGCGSANDILASAAGATAKCEDGTYTSARDIEAACRSHGGVDTDFRRFSDNRDSPRLVAPEGRWVGTWTSDVSPGLTGGFSLTIQKDGTAEGAFQSGSISGTVRGTVQVSENPALLAPPATDLVLQVASSGSAQTYSAVFNQPTPDRLVGKLTYRGAEEENSGFLGASCTVEMTRQ